MFSIIRAFISQHKRKLIFGSVFIGGAFLLSNYAKKILKECQERETKELFERNGKQQHFESVEGLCNHTALNMVSAVRNSIMQHLNTEELITNLRDKVSDKVVSWEKLKILSFARAMTLVYATSMLMVTLRIQLNLIGGYIFRDQADENKHFNNSMQGKYLSFCDHFCNTGIVKLCKLVQEKVLLILMEKSLKAEMRLQDIESVFSAVQTAVMEDSRNPCNTMGEYILPKQYWTESFETDNEYFDQIIRDTKDLFESNEVSHSVSFCVDRGKKVLMEALREYFRAKNKHTEKLNQTASSGTSKKEATTAVNMLDYDESFLDTSSISIQMAKVIPIVNGLIQNSKNDLTEKLMLELIMMDHLKVLGANVYETFSSKC